MALEQNKHTLQEGTVTAVQQSVINPLTQHMSSNALKHMCVYNQLKCFDPVLYSTFQENPLWGFSLYD